MREYNRASSKEEISAKLSRINKDLFSSTKQKLLLKSSSILNFDDSKSNRQIITIDEIDDCPKTVFSGMEQWFVLIKYEYAFMNGQRLFVVVKAKTDCDDRPHYFDINYYDADEVRVISKKYVAEPSQIKRIWAFTPSECQVQKVKSVVVTGAIS